MGAVARVRSSATGDHSLPRKAPIVLSPMMGERPTSLLSHSETSTSAAITAKPASMIGSKLPWKTTAEASMSATTMAIDVASDAVGSAEAGSVVAAGPVVSGVSVVSAVEAAAGVAAGSVACAPWRRVSSR